MAWARRVDSVSKACIAEARKWGAQWLDTSRAPGGVDGLVLYRGHITLVDWKTPQSKAGRVELTDTQTDLMSAGWPIRFLSSPADVRALLGVENGG